MRKILIVAAAVLVFGGAALFAGHVTTSERFEWRKDFTVSDSEKVTYTIDRSTPGQVTVKWELFHATWTHTTSDTNASSTTTLAGYGYFPGTFE